MLLLSSALWMILAEITCISADIEWTTSSSITTVAVTTQNNRISFQDSQQEYVSSNPSAQINYKHSNSKLLPYKIKNIETCKDLQTMNHSKTQVADVKTLEFQIREISKRNITLTEIILEFENISTGFFEDPETSVGERANNLGRYYIGNGTDLLYLIKDHNLEILKYKCMNKSNTLSRIPYEETEKIIENNKFLTKQFEYLFNLTLLHTDIYYVNEETYELMEKYNDNRKLHYLEKAIESKEKMKQLIDNYLPRLEKYFDFLGNEQLHERFSNDFTEYITDQNYWTEQAKNTTIELDKNKKYLAEEQYRILIQERIQPAAQGIIFIVGFVGNLILFIIFIRHKEIRNPPNMMVLNLAVGDTFNLIINIPTFYSYYVSASWEYSDGLCKTFRFARQLGIAVSIYSVVMISVQRFFAIAQLFKGTKNAFKMSTKAKSILVILLVWVIAALLATPHTIHAGVYNGNCYGASAEEHTYYSKFITLFDFILFCSIPVILIVSLSLSAAYLIKKSVINLPGEMMGMDKLVKSRQLSSNLLIGLTVVSGISYIPVYFFMLVYAWTDIEIITSKYIVIFLVLYTLSFANCCFNPIALYIFSRKFRRYFNVYLLCRKLESEDQSTKNTSNDTNTSIMDTKM